MGVGITMLTTVFDPKLICAFADRLFEILHRCLLKTEQGEAGGGDAANLVVRLPAEADAATGSMDA